LSDDEFFPKGAIAFFFALLAVYTGIWIWVYALMVARS